MPLAENEMELFEYEIYGKDVDGNNYTPYLTDVFATSETNAVYEAELLLGFGVVGRATLKYK